MKKEIVSSSAEETARVAREFVVSAGPGVVTLAGDLGAGKTMFCQAALAALGATGPFTSPTFSVIKQYDLADDAVGRDLGIARVYHIDAYRITSEDMKELGWDEMIAQDDVLILVEWPEKILEILPERRTSIILEAVSESERRIVITASD